MVTFNTGSLTVDMTAIDLADFGTGTVTASSTTEIDVTGAGGVLLYKLIGTGFTAFDSHGFPTDGTVTAFDFGHSTGQPASFTGLSIGTATFMGFVSENDITGLETAVLAGNDHLIGYHGNDVLVGESGNDNFNLSKGGDDTAQGGAGNDYFEVGAALTAADSIDGGTGSDKVAINGDYSAGVTLAASTLTNVEALVLGKGHDYVLTTVDATVAAGTALTVNAEGLAAANSVTFDGSAETDGVFHLDGGAGNDTLTGGAGADNFNLVKGGEDTVHGGAGNDYIALGASFDAGDTIDGGAGNDRIVLDGDYSAGVTLGPNTITNVEAIVLQNGHSYKLTLNDGNVAPGAILSVNGATLTSTHTVYFDGSAETTSRLHITGGAGADTLIGGTRSDILTGNAGNDTIDISAGGSDHAEGNAGNDTLVTGAGWSSGDIFNGGAGSDTILFDAGYLTKTLVDRSQDNAVETIKMAAGYSYDLAFTFNSNSTVTLIDASALGAGNSFTFTDETAQDQPHEAMTILGGAGNDTITPGVLESVDLSQGGNDTVYTSGDEPIYYGAAFDENDQILGGGFASIVLNGDYSAGLVMGSADQYVSGITLDSGHSYNLTLDYTDNFQSDEPPNTSFFFTFNADLASGDNLTLDTTGLNNPVALTITGGTFDVTLGGSGGIGGTATITGGASGTIDFTNGGGVVTVDQTVNSGDLFEGAGTLIIKGTFTHAVEIDRDIAPDMGDIEVSSPGANLKLADDVTPAGHAFLIDAQFTSVTLDNSADTDGSVRVEAKYGTFIGGAGNDEFDLGYYGATNACTVTGGAGGDLIGLANTKGDLLIYNGVSDSAESGNVVTGMDFVEDFNFLKDEIQLPSALLPTAIDTAITTGSLSRATFDSDMSAALGAAQLGAHHAVLFTASAGDYTNESFLVIDGNGVAGYQPGADLIIQITSNDFKDLSVDTFV
ncbi:MAG TPA: calcium-binding protein [Rhizomicrobium sp.]|jgi:Ca2+-binding RTX toxin-like protein